jgi:predicted metal-dependent hydrolase
MDIGIDGLIILIITILGIYYIYNYYINQGLIKVKSDIDNTEYTVQIKEDAKEAADLIATIKNKLKILLEHLQKTYGGSDERVAMLTANYRPERVSEGVDTPGYTSYSVNKGEQIVLCLRNKDKLMDVNTMMFVVLHEFAHLATESIGHTEEFWTNFKWILEESMNIGIYARQDFKTTNVDYCGIKITSSPL